MGMTPHYTNVEVSKFILDYVPILTSFLEIKHFNKKKSIQYIVYRPFIIKQSIKHNNISLPEITSIQNIKTEKVKPHV